MNTLLPPDAPRSYPRSQLGRRALKYIASQGWMDGPRVVPRERAAEEIEERIARLKETK